MATATEISTRALRRAGVFDVLQSPSAIDVQSATEALNAMIASWEAEGLSGDVLQLDSRFEQAVVPASRFESALAYTGQNTGIQYLLGDPLHNSEWLPSTAYELRAFVSNGANEYELVTAGTSASSGGPTGTGAEITDGTCVWCWRRVLAS